MRTKRSSPKLLTLLAILLASPGAALAGGYDTPMLYTARHMGMGGTAVAYVDDPSALFHNPAGLAHTKWITLTGDFSLLTGTITGSPRGAPKGIESNRTVAPFFLVGGAIRPTSWLAVGLAFYPVASAGATYEYVSTTTKKATLDKTRLVFLELSPGISLNLPFYRALSIGFGYRVTFVTLERSTKDADGAKVNTDINLSGSSFSGFRLGVQWKPIPYLQVGVAYRHKTVTKIDAAEATALGLKMTDPRTEFTLPSRLTAGVRGNLGPASLAVDIEYGFNSQNVKSALAAKPPGWTEGSPLLSVDNKFEWQDAVTLRVGAEYRIGVGAGGRYTIAPRLGYIFDATTANPAYPTAFGTPPAPTHVVTGGAGFDAGAWQANLALAYRFGGTTVDASEVKPDCILCSVDGEYKIGLLGAYVDFTYRFE